MSNPLRTDLYMRSMRNSLHSSTGKTLIQIILHLYQWDKQGLQANLVERYTN